MYHVSIFFKICLFACVFVTIGGILGGDWDQNRLEGEDTTGSRPVVVGRREWEKSREGSGSMESKDTEHLTSVLLYANDDPYEPLPHKKRTNTVVRKPVIIGISYPFAIDTFLYNI